MSEEEIEALKARVAELEAAIGAVGDAAEEGDPRLVDLPVSMEFAVAWTALRRVAKKGGSVTTRAIQKRMSDEIVSLRAQVKALTAERDALERDVDKTNQIALEIMRERDEAQCIANLAMETGLRVAEERENAMRETWKEAWFKQREATGKHGADAYRLEQELADMRRTWQQNADALQAGDDPRVADLCALHDILYAAWVKERDELRAALDRCRGGT